VKRHIRKGWGVFSRCVRYEVGNKTKIRLWHDLWRGDQPLGGTFSELFSIACCKEVCMTDNLQFSNEHLQLNLSFIKPVHRCMIGRWR
jgi:hypothetical protein